MSDQTRLIRALQSEVAAAVKEAERRFKVQHPDAGRLKLKAEITAYKPRSKEQRETAYRVVALLLRDPKLVNEPNREVLRVLGEETGIKVPASILTEPFSSIMSKRVHTLLADRNIGLSVSEHYTPSKLKLALRAHNAGSDAVSKKTVTFAFTADAVIVGEKTYPIHGQGSLRRIDVRSRKLNAGALRHLILGEE